MADRPHGSAFGLFQTPVPAYTMGHAMRGRLGVAAV